VEVTGEVPDESVSGQEIAAHVFIPLDGPQAAEADATVRAIWSRCRARLAADRPIAQDWPSAPPAPPLAAAAAGVRSGSAVLAACENGGRDVQIVLRREHEVACLSILLGHRPHDTWLGLDPLLQSVLGTDREALLGIAVLYLGKAAAGPQGGLAVAPQITDGIRDLLPAGGPGGQWWLRGCAMAGLGVWENSPYDDDRTERRFAMLALECEDKELSRWAWSDGGAAALPAFSRYLMHMAKVRYQVNVYSQLPGVAELAGSWSAAGRTGPAPGRLAEAITLRAIMGQTVQIARANAAGALGGHVPDPAAAGLFQDDFDLLAWFSRQLENDVAYLDTYYQGARRMREQQEVLQNTEMTPNTPARPASHPAAEQSTTEPLTTEQPATGNRAAAPTGRPPVVLALVDEWFPTRGGLSALNRLLCIALAGHGCPVFCALPAASAAELEDAAAAGVGLVVASAVPALTEREALLRRPPLPGGLVPDLVVGHGRVTGPAAKAVAEDHFPQAARLHFVHMEPDQVEWYKLDREDDAATRAEVRSELELELGRDAARVVAVGPRLDQWMQRDLPLHGPVPPHRLDPGFEPRTDGPGLGAGGSAGTGPGPDARTVPAGVPQILAIGRMEDYSIKGLDLAARALGRALQFTPGERWELLVRGAPLGQGENLRTAVREWIGRPIEVTVRNYSAEFDRIDRDLRRASLLLMPSRAEGFGLVGMQGIVAGTPVLVSENSGLGMLLRELLPTHLADLLVLPVDDAPDRDVPLLWGGRISSVMLDRKRAFERAAEVREILAAQRTWPMAAAQLLAAVWE
jgi:glycosyltransferase involved in cell wall biosynthesis